MEPNDSNQLISIDGAAAERTILWLACASMTAPGGVWLLMKSRFFLAVATALLLHPHATALADGAADSVPHGRYLVVITGCNACHTANWDQSGGAVPDAEWLTGSPVGFRGPWGTTYASNLRILASEMDENAWVAMLHTRKDRPPMPWVDVNAMNESDARAIYRFIRSLGSAGNRMPLAIAPDVEPQTPFILFEPQFPNNGQQSGQ